VHASTPLEDQVRALAHQLEAMEQRLSALEGCAAPPPASDGEVPAVERLPPPPALAVPGFDARRWTTALGRAFIILGGAFLLRALTDAGVWPPAAGVSLGLIYAAGWVISSDRAAMAGDRVRALFDGGTALIIGFPLIVEATMRFRLLDGESAALALAAFSAVTLSSAWKSNLRALAWVGTVGGMLTGLTLMVRVGVVAPYSLYFTALGAGTLWLGYLRGWKALRWLTGALAVAGVLGVTSRALADPPADSAGTAWFVQGALLAAYFASIAIRTLVRGRQVIVFEVVQTVFVLPAAVGGAFAVSRAAGEGGLVLGGALVALGVIAYLVSFPFLPRESRGALNFYFYSTLALAFVLVGLQTALTGAPRAVAFTVLVGLLAAAWSRSGRVSLGGHAAVALAAATMASGLVDLAAAAFIGVVSEPGGAAVLVMLAAVILTGTVAAGCDLPRPRATDVPALVIALVAVAGGAGALTLLVAGAARGLGLPDLDPGALATVRTAVLSLVAVGCAMVDRPGRFSAAGKMAYPVLAAIGFKLALVDLRYSTPATLFVALAVYGAALVLVPRLRRAPATGG